MRTTYITATAIAAIIGVWLLSGQIDDNGIDRHPTVAEQNLADAAAMEDRPATRVRARTIRSQPQTESVLIRGRTANKRTVEVRAETEGRIVERPIERGSRVEAGRLLCRLATDDRQARVVETQAAVAQAEIEYKGSLELQAKGYQSETAIASAKARLESARAALERSQLELERTFVRAPFAGLVENTHVEVGDYASRGSGCATVIDLDPMLLVGRVPENSVHRLRVQQMARGQLSDGRVVQGPVTFIGKQSDGATRTYPIEIEIKNQDLSIRSGITTEIRIPVDTVAAHQISPALLTLDDEGRLGVRTLDSDNRVRLNLVTIVREDPDGIWVTGLPDTATVITVGQEFVVPGEVVDVSFEAGPEMPAATEPAQTDKQMEDAKTGRPTAVNVGTLASAT